MPHSKHFPVPAPPDTCDDEGDSVDTDNTELYKPA